ncbi:uncharacterized protein LOC122293489 [Carya illinoinensis]|uniref:uncharacterized protein LOC122293489 n=1 Tax=Carya illinoinensis TaxID=32201 RepID=UPI001C725DB8|nr:uncharacterized protein LOC122293489 [Carya illinoinensis]
MLHVLQGRNDAVDSTVQILSGFEISSVETDIRCYTDVYLAKMGINGKRGGLYQEDFNKAFSREACEINRVPYRAFHWTPGFTEDEEMPFVPVWVMLLGLPPNFYHDSILKIITAQIGKFIRSDNSTRCVTTTDGARVCLEMDASIQHLDSFWIGAPGTGFKQEVVFEMLPAFCLSCKMQGHNKATCKREKKNQEYQKSNSPVRVEGEIEEQQEE